MQSKLSAGRAPSSARPRRRRRQRGALVTLPELLSFDFLVCPCALCQGAPILLPRRLPRRSIVPVSTVSLFGGGSCRGSVTLGYQALRLSVPIISSGAIAARASSPFRQLLLRACPQPLEMCSDGTLPAVISKGRGHHWQARVSDVRTSVCQLVPRRAVYENNYILPLATRQASASSSIPLR